MMPPVRCQSLTMILFPTGTDKLIYDKYAAWAAGKLDHMELMGKKVLVFGTGISGIGADSLLEKVGASVVLYDGNTELKEEDIRAKLTGEGKAQIVIGELTDDLVAGLDLAVLSPGVPTDIPPVLKLKEAGVRIWGEVELAYECSKGEVLAITGTNGKTTTTTLVGEIMKYHLEQATAPKKDQRFVVGNIGTPYTEASLLTTEDSVCVAEISSFQLETIDRFHAAVSAITNITPDHLNRHHTMEEYIRVKERITENQTAEDTCVLNYEDEVLREFGKNCTPKVIYFSSARVLETGICLNGDVIEMRENGRAVPVVNIHDLKLLGLHNYENIMVAVAMTFAYGVPLQEIVEVLKNFTAVEHRIEYVAEKNGVTYYNDSKGTNPDAAIKGIQAMIRPTVLIGGGYDKDNTYDEWIQSFDGKVTYLVLIGQTKEKIAAAAKANGFENVILADTFEEAFDICVEKARPGDAVLLSPACASWGMFPNYEVRGKIFKELVGKLPD